VLDRAELTAHAMLTQALERTPVVRPGFAAVDLGLACVWLRARATRLLADAPEPHDLLRRAAHAVAQAPTGPPSASWQAQTDGPTAAWHAGDSPSPSWRAAGSSSASWQQAAALEIVAGELAGEGARVDPRTVQHLTRDPDGMLVALAELTAQLFRLHDGDGARAVVRALAPD
jgi:hypothetical protein